MTKARLMTWTAAIAAAASLGMYLFDLHEGALVLGVGSLAIMELFGWRNAR